MDEKIVIISGFERIGKTMAAMHWIAAYPGLVTIVHADNYEEEAKEIEYQKLLEEATKEKLKSSFEINTFANVIPECTCADIIAEEPQKHFVQYVQRDTVNCSKGSKGPGEAARGPPADTAV